MSHTNTVRDSIENVLQQIADAYVKKAGLGSTKHPSGKAPDGTVDATPGPRAQENSADVKRLYSASPDEGGPKQTQDDVQPNVGVRQSATGEDPAHETGSVSMIPEDDQIGGKTSHPARADKIKSAEDLQRYCDQATKLASAILDDFERTLRTSNPYEVAGYMSAYTADHIPQMENMEDIGVDAAQIKLAEDAHSVLSQTILEGMSLAHLCADYLDSYIKTAEEIEENPEILAALSGGEAPEMTDEEAEVAEDEDEEIPPELLLSLLQHDDSDEEEEEEGEDEVDPELLALLMHLNQNDEEDSDSDIGEEDDEEALRAALQDAEGKTASAKRKFKSAEQLRRYNKYRQIINEYVNS